MATGPGAIPPNITCPARLGPAPAGRPGKRARALDQVDSDPKSVKLNPNGVTQTGVQVRGQVNLKFMGQTVAHEFSLAVSYFTQTVAHELSCST